MKCIGIFLFNLFVAANAFSAGHLYKSTIAKVSFNSKGFYLTASGGWNNPSSCENTNSVVLLDTDANYDKAYALLLAAYMSGKQVSGYSNGCVDHDGKTFNTIRGYKYLVVH